MQNVEFKNKEEYLAWVKDWKAEYKALSEEIRTLKKQRKEYIWQYRPKNMTTIKRRTKIGPNPDYNSSAGWQAAMRRETASYLMEQRTESKRRAAEQMKETKKAA